MGSQHEHSPEQQARRHLLKLASYVPPAILGVMIVGPRVVQADDDYGHYGDHGGHGDHHGHHHGGGMDCGNGQIVVSAGGTACCPCVSSSPYYNPTVCNQKKCELGNCSACRQLVFSNQGRCKQVTANCHSCNCTRIGHGQSQFWVCQ